jgi:hypothetical protein
MPMKLQKEIFERLKQHLPPGKSMAEYIGNILFLSNDSVYRRLRGETLLSVDELQMICKSFGLSADSLLNLRQDDEITCRISKMGKSPLSFSDFLGSLLEDLKKLNQFQDKRVIYSGKDIPVLYSIMFPRLFAFKYYMWMQVFAQSPEYFTKQFEPIISDVETKELIDRIMQEYKKAPSIEIWNEENVHSLLLQIDFYRHSKFFANPDVIKGLFDEVHELINHIEKQADLGCKLLPGEDERQRGAEFQMFLNQVSLSDNIILVKASAKSKVYINYSVINYLTTTDQHFCKEMEEYLENILKRSTQISIENVKRRSMYFNLLHEKVDSYQKKH